MTSRRLGTESGAIRRLLAAVVGFVLALLGLTLAAGPAAAQNVVGPQPVQTILTIGPHDSAGQESTGVRGPPLHQLVSATGVAAETATAGGRSVDEILGGPSKGKNSGVWTVPDQSTLQSTFDELRQGGTATTWKNYSGPVYELPDGTQIGLRGSSTSGGPTIDIRVPGQDPFKIHIG